MSQHTKTGGKCTTQNLLNGHKFDQMAVKYTNTFQHHGKKNQNRRDKNITLTSESCVAVMKCSPDLEMVRAVRLLCRPSTS
jgi:hypothetical protein